MWREVVLKPRKQYYRYFLAIRTTARNPLAKNVLPRNGAAKIRKYCKYKKPFPPKLSGSRAAETKSPAGAPAGVIDFGSRFSLVCMDSIVKTLTLISVLVSQFFI
jgi:hypothetical protein